MAKRKGGLIDQNKLIEKIEKWIEDYEPTFDCPVEKQDKEGNVTTTMKSRPSPYPAIQRLAKDIGVSRSYFYALLEKNKRLKDKIEKLFKPLKKWALVENGLSGEWSSSFAKFVATNETDMKDKQEVDHTGLPAIPTTLEVVLKDATD